MVKRVCTLQKISIADAKSSPLLHKEKDSDIFEVADIPKLMESNPDYLFHMPKGQEFLNWRGNLKPVFHDTKYRYILPVEDIY